MRHRALILAALLFALGCGDAATAPGTPPQGGTDLPSEADFLAEVDRTMGFRDCFAVLRDPEFVAVDGAHRVRDDERVLGLDLGRSQVAYPTLYLNRHEIVEHTLAGVHLLACW